MVGKIKHLHNWSRIRKEQSIEDLNVFTLMALSEIILLV